MGQVSAVLTATVAAKRQVYLNCTRWTMLGGRIAKLSAWVGPVLLLAACSDQASTPTTPDSARPAMAAVGTTPDPFTFRAPLDPYRINQPPDFMIHSRETSDIVIQRLVLAPGPGGWHTHPGPSFVIVEQGRIKLTRVAEVPGTDGCEDTEVFGPGQAFVEVGNEVHRPTVLSTESAVLHVTRFNIPVGAPISTPAADPGC